MKTCYVFVVYDVLWLLYYAALIGLVDVLKIHSARGSTMMGAAC